MKWWISSIILCVLCGLSSYTGVAANSQNGKVSWANPYIQKVVERKIMPLDQNGRFNTFDGVTRSEAVQAIIQARAIPLDAKQPLLAKDVQKNHPQYAAFQKLVELGVLENAAYLKPDAYVTRAQIAKMIALAFQIEVDNQNTASFPDVKRTYWAKDYIESLTDIGIFQGKLDGRFGPYESLRKGQLAKIIVEAQAFEEQLKRYEIAYNVLGKEYIMTPVEHEQSVQAVYRLINEYRAKHQLPALTLEPHLRQMAVIKAYDMLENKYFSHRSPYYGHTWDLVTLYDYSFSALGENLAQQYKTPQQVVEAWIASPSHQANILTANYTHTGIALAKGNNGKYYWVQLFSRK